MSESRENRNPASYPTSEVGCGTHECRESDANGHITNKPNDVDHVACGAGSAGGASASDATALLQLLRGLAGGL